MNTKLLGTWGEVQAAGYLKAQGYKITGMSYRTRFGEIDLIAENREFIVFIEVKLRKNANFAKAKEYVDRKKIQRIIATAAIWLSENETKKQPRFDVIEVYAPDGADTKKENMRIEHWENAFGEEK